jgi:hypothetical protein
MGLTHSIRVGKLQLMRVEDVIHAGGCPLLQGTMQNDQGLLGHARVHENVYPASKSHEIKRLLPPKSHFGDGLLQKLTKA